MFIITLSRRTVQTKKTKNFQVDKDGSYYESGQIVDHHPHKWRRKGGFALICKTGAEKIATLGLKGRQHDILWLLISRVGWNNVVEINQQEIADTLVMQRPHVTKDLKILEELGIIHSCRPKGSSYKQYRLNLQLIAYGQASIRSSNSGHEFRIEASGELSPHGSPREGGATIRKSCLSRIVVWRASAISH